MRCRSLLHENSDQILIQDSNTEYANRIWILILEPKFKNSKFVTPVPACATSQLAPVTSAFVTNWSVCHES